MKETEDPNLAVWIIPNKSARLDHSEQMSTFGSFQTNRELPIIPLSKAILL